MLKIAFLGSKEVGYQSLKFLIDQATRLDIKFVAVLSNDRKISASGNSVIELAVRNGLNVLQTTDDLLSIPEIDFIVSVQYHEILQQQHINKAQQLAINLHMAPLPEYRGCNQFSFAIIDRAEQFGATLHVLESGIDSGDILFEKRFPVAPNETVMTLYQKTEEASIVLFKESIPLIFKGKYQRIPQQLFEGIRPFGFHLRKEINHIKQINPNWDDEKIDRYVRATYFPPFAPPFAHVNGKKIELSPNWKTELNR